MSKPQVPFSRDYVLRETLRRMQVCISISTQKTLERLQDFADDNDKKKEILATLSDLSRLNTLMNQVREENKEILKA